MSTSPDPHPNPVTATMPRRHFRRRPDHAVAAVQLNLETGGLHYRDWGHDQQAKPGDWLVVREVGGVAGAGGAVVAQSRRRSSTSRRR